MSGLPPRVPRSLFLVLVLTLVASGQNAAPPKDLYHRLYGASVEILLDGRQVGSGFFIDAKGRVGTAAHFFTKVPGRLEIVSPVGGRVTAKLIALDRGFDAAVLSVPERKGGWPALKLATSMPAPGAPVFLLGAPIYRHAVMIRGALARARPAFEYYSEALKYVAVYHVSAMVQGGTSGGPWVNARGEVLGVQSGTMSQDGRSVGIAYMAPADGLRRILSTGKHAHTPTPGLALEHMWEQDEKFIAKAGREGVVVRGVHAQGAGAGAGLELWDVILAVDGQGVRYVHDVVERVRHKRVGDSLTLRVLKPESRKEVERTVKLHRLEPGWIVDLR